MQKLAEAKLAARPSAEARGQAPAAAALPRKEAPLLFDLVYAGLQACASRRAVEALSALTSLQRHLTWQEP